MAIHFASRRVGWLWGSAFAVWACGGHSAALTTEPRTDSGAGSSGDIWTADDSGADATTASRNCSSDGSVCTGLCPGLTTLRGTVFDPAGRNRVLNAAVWVPVTTPDPMPAALTCDCASLYTGGVLGTYALTSADGSFHIDGAPSPLAGTSIPLVVQRGKWRYQTRVDVVCGQDNIVPDGMLRLPQGGPSTGVAFAGDLPQIAISTGGADTLECLLTRMGVSEQEYAPGGGGSQHVHIFQGSPADVAPNTPTPAPQSASSLWDSVDHLAQFDAVLLSCEGTPTTGANPQALYDYGTIGGHVFASHQHFPWFLGLPFPSAGTWFTQNSNRLVAPAYGTIATTLPTGAPFPMGKEMMQWLQAAGALDSNNELPITDAYHTIDVPPSVRPLSPWIPWIYYDASRSTLQPASTAGDPVDSASALYLSYDFGSANGSCGGVVYSDLHSANPTDYGPNHAAVPAGCSATDALSSQEKALEFMIFDLASCSALASHSSGPDSGFAK